MINSKNEVISKSAMLEILSQVDPACLSGDALYAACWWMLGVGDCPLYRKFNEEYQNRIQGYNLDDER